MAECNYPESCKMVSGFDKRLTILEKQEINARVTKLENQQAEHFHQIEESWLSVVRNNKRFLEAQEEMRKELDSWIAEFRAHRATHNANIRKEIKDSNRPASMHDINLVEEEITKNTALTVKRQFEEYEIAAKSAKEQKQRLQYLLFGSIVVSCLEIIRVVIEKWPK